MKKTLFKSIKICLVFIFAVSLQANNMLWDGFKSGKIENYFPGTNSIQLLKAGNDEFSLKFPVGKRRIQVTTLKTPVKEGEHYKFSFVCKVDGPYTFEKNPQLENLLIMSNRDRKQIAHVQGLPGWRLYFKDRNGKNIRRGFTQFFTCMLSGHNKKYIEEFIVPLKAETMSIGFSNGNADTSLIISDLRLEKINNPESLNVNYNFALGRLNYSGWNQNLRFACKIRENPKKPGVFQYDTRKGQAKTDPIDVKPETKYNIHYRFSSKSRSRVRVYFQGKNRKEKLLRSFIDVAGVSKGRGIEGITTIVTPPKTKYISITINNGIYDYVKITEFNKNDKITRKYFKGE